VCNEAAVQGKEDDLTWSEKRTLLLVAFDPSWYVGLLDITQTHVLLGKAARSLRQGWHHACAAWNEDLKKQWQELLYAGDTMIM